jgi:hypothetical protein
MQGLKSHLSKTHEGWQDDEIVRIANAATAKAGGESAGSSLEELRSTAPETAAGKPAGVSEPVVRVRRSSIRSTLEEQKRFLERTFSEARAKKIAEWFACGPFRAIATYLDEPKIRLSNDEAQPLLESYVELFRAYGINFDSKLWCFAIILMNTGELIGSRWPMMTAAWERKVIHSETEKSSENMAKVN